MLFALLAAACGGDAPADPDPGGNGPPDVQRANLEIRASITSRDQAVASKLGFTGGVPGVEVEIEREGTGERFAALSDADGVVRFEDLLEGGYRISGIRVLEPGERALLTDGDADVNALAGAASVRVDPPGATAELLLTAGRPGSLVISEIWFGNFDLAAYPYSFFLELYNNSDTTIYLDGKLVGRGMNGLHDYPNYSCARYNDLRTDPEGVWVWVLFRFPGMGRQYSVAPGRAVVVATDAIDHSELAEGRLDLSNADFEFLGTADVDNPQVPNLVSAGERSCCLGRGLFLSTLDDILVIADAADVETMPRAVWDNDIPLVRIPAARVLDVLTHIKDGTDYPVCPRPINERFDRQASLAFTGTSNDRRGLTRRPLFTTETARLVLQRTRTSSRDFRLGDPDPGVVQ